MYGLLAQEMRIEPDLSAITFRLHPLARFTNGDAVTAADVKYSFDSLSGKYASPTYSSTLVGVREATVIDERTIRFDLVRPQQRHAVQARRAAGVLAQMGAQARWHAHALRRDRQRDTRSPAGPTRSTSPTRGGASSSSSTRTTGRATCRCGAASSTSSRVVYRYYQDEAVATEAFKAGEFDLVRVYGAGVWMRQHKGPKWDDGRIVKQAIPIGTGQGLQSYQLNLRRPLFQDIRVREALGLTYDFETNNRYRLFKRANSVFSNSDFAAEGLPSAGELELLEPYRKELPKEVFGPPFVAPRTDSDVHALRRNLLKARALLEAAGWKLGARRQAAQRPGRAVRVRVPRARRQRQRRAPEGLGAQPRQARHHASRCATSTSPSTAGAWRSTTST